MCDVRDNDPNDARRGKTVVTDCQRCDCPTGTSARNGQHDYYHGVCLGCGRPG